MSTEIPILRQIYDELYIKRLVKNQRDLAARLALTPSYISRLLKSTEILPKEVVTAINREYNISLEWLASNGREGKMWNAPSPPKEKPVTEKRAQANARKEGLENRAETAIFETPDKKQDYISMTDFMNYLKEEQTLRKQNSAQMGELIGSNTLLAQTNSVLAHKIAGTPYNSSAGERNRAAS